MFGDLNSGVRFMAILTSEWCGCRFLRGIGRYAGFLAIGGVFSCLVVTGTSYAAGERGQDRVFLFSGATVGGGQEVLAFQFRDSLSNDYRVLPSRTESNLETIAAIAEDPSLVGLTRLDIFVDYVSKHAGLAGQLELYGEIPICAFIATRSGTALDQLSANEVSSSRSIDVGRPGDLDTHFMVNSIWPETLAMEDNPQSKLEQIGGYRAFEKVSLGSLEASVFIEIPDLSMPLLKYVYEHPALELTGVTNSVLEEGQAHLGWELDSDLGARGYIPTTISMQSPGWLPNTMNIRTICTSLGVLINNQVSTPEDHRYIDAVVASISKDTLFEASLYHQLISDSADWVHILKTYALQQLGKGIEVIGDVKSTYF